MFYPDSPPPSTPPAAAILAWSLVGFPLMGCHRHTQKH
jgi:hypothetical protein